MEEILNKNRRCEYWKETKEVIGCSKKSLIDRNRWFTIRVGNIAIAPLSCGGEVGRKCIDFKSGEGGQ